jgi:RimJ/RimL family protein N-acetyltransferase
MLIATERLIIRDWTLDDVPGNLRLYGDPEVMKFLGGGGKVRETDEECRESLEKFLELQRSRTGGFGAWAFLEKGGDQPIGTILLKHLPPENKDVEIGWHLAREFWGRGYATEAATAIMRYGFEDLGLDTIFAVLFAENVRSRAVTERLGMRYVGKTTKYYDLELELFEKKRADWMSLIMGI